MAIPFTQIHEQLKSYARLDTSVFIPDSRPIVLPDHEVDLLPSMNELKKEQILNDIRMKVLEKIKEHARSTMKDEP